MYCVNHEYDEAVHQCSKCGVDICERCNAAPRDKDPICIDCDEEIQARRKQWRLPKLVAALISAYLILGPYGLQIFGRPAPEDQVTLQQRLTDECIANLDDVGELISAGQEPVAGARCLPDHDPFLVTQQGELITVSVPNPETFGFSQMYVTNKDPVPVLVD